MFETWHGRMLLRTGRLSEAAAELDGRFALEDGTHAAAVLDAAGIVALGRVAIHAGDTRQARRLGDIAQVMRSSVHASGPAPRRLATRAPRAGQGRRRSSTGMAARTNRGGWPRRDPAAIPGRHRRRGATCTHRDRSTRDDAVRRSSHSSTRGAERSSIPTSRQSARRRLTSAVSSSRVTWISVRRPIYSSAPRDRSSWRLHSKTSGRNSPRPTGTPPSTSLAGPSRCSRSSARSGTPRLRPRPPARARRPSPHRHRRNPQRAVGQR